jgi:hypothetical protein
MNFVGTAEDKTCFRNVKWHLATVTASDSLSLDALRCASVDIVRGVVRVEDLVQDDNYRLGITPVEYDTSWQVCRRRAYHLHHLYCYKMGHEGLCLPVVSDSLPFGYMEHA